MEVTPMKPCKTKAVNSFLCWKVDPDDLCLTFGSLAPWDEAQIKRVLTINLADAYCGLGQDPLRPPRRGTGEPER